MPDTPAPDLDATALAHRLFGTAQSLRHRLQAQWTASGISQDSPTYFSPFDALGNDERIRRTPRHRPHD